MKINNYVWENDLSLNDLVLKQKEKIDELEHQLQQKDNIIKEVREYIDKDVAYCKAINEPITKQQYILEILDKVGDEK